MNPLIFTYLLMMLFQVWHIFEEIAMGAYKLIDHGLNRYILVASVLVTINFVTFTLLLLENRFGLYLGLFTSSILAVGNGIIHLVGAVITRKFRDSLGSGVFSGIPLGVVGVIVFIQIINAL